MAREKHLTAIHIGNFKHFVDFKVENLGQFNLVVGDNNTGKTSFLEALLVDENAANWIVNLATIIAQRTSSFFQGELDYLINNFYLLLNDFDKTKYIYVKLYHSTCSTSYTLSSFNLERDIKNLEGITRERVLLTLNPRGFTVSNKDVIEVVLEQAIIDQVKVVDRCSFIPFIPFGLGYSSYLQEYFAEYIDKDISTRLKFIEQLKLFIPLIQDVRLGQDVINIFEKGINHPKPLHAYGEGSTKFFRILCEIAIAKGKRLMIDEIDAGIHHTKFIQFWKAVIQAATEFDVQIFMTTHNEECLKYFQMALELEELQQQRALARVIALKLRKEQKIRAKVYDFASLQVVEKLGHEIRGGGL